MKIKVLACLIFVLACSLPVFSQKSVIITPKKVTYTRKKPMSDYKKSFVVTYPKVKASSPALSRKIETEISYEKNNNFNLKKELTEIQWLEQADYKVNYNKRGILEITLFMEGSGAYPSSFSETVVINTKTGSRVRPSDVFTDLPKLAAKIRTAQQTEIKKAKEEYKKEAAENDNFDGSEYFDNAKYTIENLKNFSVSDRGVTFSYDYGFPHVSQALQPDGKYFYSWAELKPFIRRDGLLGQFIR